MSGASEPGLDFLVDKRDWHRHRFAETPTPPEPATGQVLFRVDRFALTANNISYAMAGELLGYWRFFPAEEGWGRIPAMGYGEVIRSRHPGVAEGTRCFGFYPMSRYLVIEPASASASSIVDGAAHREGLAPAYNQYLPADGDPLYAEHREDEIMLLRGLFMTSFLVEDFLSDNDLYGAESILISSASSKTSIALAFVARQRARARTIGLTSARHHDFVKALGCYDEVARYEDLASIANESPAVFVDMAGNAGLTRKLHAHFGDRLRFSSRVGATHWDAAPAAEGELAGPTPEFFFAPAQIEKRTREWGPGGLQDRIGRAWNEYCQFSDDWLRVRRCRGRTALERTYGATLEARTMPANGHVLSLFDEEVGARAE